VGLREKDGTRSWNRGAHRYCGHPLAAIRFAFHVHVEKGLRSGCWRTTRSASRSRRALLHSAKPQADSGEHRKATAPDPREPRKKQLQQAQERAQASAQETLRLTEQGQITERFTRAIEQLGATHDGKSKNLELRLGGSTPSNGSPGSPRKITSPSWRC
jgi:hypothetical protein